MRRVIRKMRRGLIGTAGRIVNWRDDLPLGSRHTAQRDVVAIDPGVFSSPLEDIGEILIFLEADGHVRTRSEIVVQAEGDLCSWVAQVASANKFWIQADLQLLYPIGVEQLVDVLEG